MTGTDMLEWLGSFWVPSAELDCRTRYKITTIMIRKDSPKKEIKLLPISFGCGSPFCCSSSHHHPHQNGDTALHIAAAMGRRKLTRVLLEAGEGKLVGIFLWTTCTLKYKADFFNFQVRNHQGETPGDIAVRKGWKEVNIYDTVIVCWWNWAYTTLEFKLSMQ